MKIFPIKYRLLLTFPSQKNKTNSTILKSTKLLSKPNTKVAIGYGAMETKLSKLTTRKNGTL